MMHVYARAALGRTGLSGFVVMLKMMQWERILYAPQLHVNEQRCGQSSFTLQSNVMPIIVYTQRCHFCTLICHSSFVLFALPFDPKCSPNLTYRVLGMSYFFTTEYVLLLQNQCRSIYTV